MGSSSEYFGLINIGDKSRFLTLVEEQFEDIVIEDDKITTPLFDQLKSKDSQINLLIGSKMFMQGWDSWRVSNMGLLNVGRGEGPEIIQLFGRGVRLLGKDRSLKRTSALGTEVSEDMKTVETLNIFGINADYMRRFKEYLEKEGIETGYWKTQVNIKKERRFLEKGLKVPYVEQGHEFKKERSVILDFQEEIRPTLNLYPKIERLKSDESLSLLAEHTEKRRYIEKDLLFILDWDEIYFDLIGFKLSKKYYNLFIDKECLKQILQEKHYALYCPKYWTTIDNLAERSKLNTIAKMMLRKYVDLFYKEKRREWENNYLEYKIIDENSTNFKNYSISIPKSEKKLIQQIEKVMEGEAIYTEDTQPIPSVYFTNHLYKPLLVKDKKEHIEITPVGLNKEEKQFVIDLKHYCEKLNLNNPLNRKEIFLLRNAERRGVGFFEAGNFYPDFILWIKEEKHQYVVFIDPHGLVQSILKNGLDADPKIRLFKAIKDIETRIRERTGDDTVTLESFILSVTDKKDVRKTIESQGDIVTDQDFKNKHILFQEDPKYIQSMFSSINSRF